ncbi:hypothetical protein ACQAYK_12020 [Acidithiobacillus sp. AC3]
MSYSPEDAAWDEAYESMFRELYPEHKEQAIAEFTSERLRSYYVAHPEVLVPAARAFKEAKMLHANGHHSAALVFAASATELFLKSSLLRPVVYGLVHNESLAELVVAAALSQTGFMRYEKLLAKLFVELAGVELTTLRRQPEAKPLLREAADIQELRNAVIHQGQAITLEQAQHGIDVSTEVFNQMLAAVLSNLGLSLEKGGRLVTKEF